MISYCFSSENVEEAALKSHIFIFWNQKLRVDNSELLNLHKRLSIQSLKFEKYRPMSTVCQHLYTLGAVVCFTRIGDFTWRVSDCEVLVVIAQRSESHFLKLNGTLEAQFDFV